jgi:hypothetical protein
VTLNVARARQLLAKGDLRTLFVEELGWDRHSAPLQPARLHLQEHHP